MCTRKDIIKVDREGVDRIELVEDEIQVDSCERANEPWVSIKGEEFC
jgi:hypothetical protein